MNRRLIMERAAESIAAWNRHDADGVVAHAVEDLILRDIALTMPLHGREAVRAATREYLRAFPDLRLSVTSETVDGPRVVLEWTSEATHGGEIMGVAPTGRAVRVFGVSVFTYDDDARVIEAAMYWNPLAVFQQLGVAVSSEPATTA
jgi:steroid delta-isomerase-like uncharacterized protein